VTSGTFAWLSTLPFLEIASDRWLSTLISLGTDVGGIGAPFLPRGPLPNSARLLNFFRPWSGTALRLTTGDVVSGDVSVGSLLSP
jgi:hypothetical protein